MKKIMKGSLFFINVILYITIIIMWISLPEYFTLNISTTIFTICMTLILLYTEKEKVQEMISSSFFEQLMTNVIRAGLVLGLLCVANYVVFKFPKQWDMTSERMNSLSDETEKTIAKVDSTLEFYVFATGMERQQAVMILELYKSLNNNIQIKPIDPENNPGLVQEFGLKQIGDIGVKYKDKREVISSYDEITITKMILKLMRDKQPKVLFTSGHQELAFNDHNPGSISKVYSYLIHSHYQIDNTSLMELESLENYAAVFILGPKKPFLDNEIKALEGYVEKGGRLFVALDPDFKFKGRRKLEQLISKWGIELSNNIVMDSKSKVKGSKGLVPIVSSFNKNHDLTKKFRGTLFFPLTSSVEINAKANPKFKLSNLLHTSDFPNSWAKTDLDEIINGNYEFTKGIRGPVSIASSMVHNFIKDKSSKVLAFGSSKFITNMYFDHGDNINFFLNLVSWLVEEDFVISSSRAAIHKKPAFLNPAQLNIIFFFSVIFVPLLCGGFAFVLYRRKRAW